MSKEGFTRDSKLSVVIPVSERHDTLSDLVADYAQALAKVADKIDFTIVIDGEFPKAVAQLQGMQPVGYRLNIIQLARKFGESTALAIGFDNVEGDYIMTLPAYQQVETDALPGLFEALNGSDLVIGRRWPRLDSKFNQLTTRLFHRVIRFITGFTYRDLGCSVRLMRRCVVDEVRLYGDQHRFLPVLAAYRGFDVHEKSIPQSTHEERYRVYQPGVYFRRLLDVFTVFFLVRFTKKPLRFFGIIGGLLLIVGGIALAYIIAQRLFFGLELGDRPALVIATLMVVLGTQLIALGLVGELVIFSSARQDREYTVAELINISPQE